MFVVRLATQGPDGEAVRVPGWPEMRRKIRGIIIGDIIIQGYVLAGLGRMLLIIWFGCDVGSG